MQNPPLCAIWVVTYNQKKFIAQTLVSILQQKTEFPFKIYIGDDCSTDGTREICVQFKEAHPGIIELVFNSVNLMNLNSANVYKACFTSGARYTAMCEGDDYWNDPYKLQKQVSFLETHDSYVGCFHNTEERYENDEVKASFLYCGYQDAREFSFRDIAYGNIIPTCSVVFRNNLFGEFPAWYPKLKMGDWPLHLLNAQFGNFWYMPKIMSVHRLHKASTWMLQDAEKNNRFIEEAYDAMIAGFAGYPEHAAYLVEGKKHFLEQIHRAKKRAGVKAKVKDIMIRQIRKL